VTKSSSKAGTVHKPRRRGASSGPHPYDFRHPIKLSREHTRIMQIALEGYARQVTTLFTSTLRTVSEVSLARINQQTYAEYVESLPDTTYMTLFSIDPIPGSGVLEMPIQMAMTCVDHLLGGPGTSEQPNRPLTDIERKLMAKLVERLMAELSYALQPIVATAAEPTGVEYAPQFAQAASATDVVVVISFDVSIGDTTHAATLCLPFSPMLPYLAEASGAGAMSLRERAVRAEAAANLTETVQDVPMDVAVRLRPTRMDPEQLWSLDIGSVLVLDHPKDAPLDVAVGSTVFAHATTGVKGRHMAARVVSTAEKE
jgi:flagellar motor switch protein FliM